MGKKEEKLVVAEALEVFGDRARMGREIGQYRTPEFVRQGIGCIKKSAKRLRIGTIGVFQNGRYLGLLDSF